MLKTLTPFTNSKSGVKISFKRYDLEINRNYLLIVTTRKPIEVKFIQVTPKGYNFLNIKTGQCIFDTAMSNAYFGDITGEKLGILMPDKFIRLEPIDDENIETETIIRKRDGFLRITWSGNTEDPVEIKEN